MIEWRGVVGWGLGEWRLRLGSTKEEAVMAGSRRERFVDAGTQAQCLLLSRELCRREGLGG
jgi:hypothetical protein